MAELARIYVVLIGSRIRSQMSYRASFWLTVVGQALLTFTDFLMIAVLFTHLRALEGWSLAEIAVLYGVSSITVRLGDMFLGQVEQVPVYIRTGSFDTYLVRPLGSLFQVVTGEFYAHQLGGLVQGGAVLAVALSRAGIDWTPWRAALLPVAIMSGFAIFGAIFVVSNAIAFWLIDSREMANAFTYGGGMFAEYPLGVFGAWMRRMFVYVVPIGFVSYFPTLAILGRDDPLGFPNVFRFASPVAAAVSCSVAAWVWRTAVRHYRSTGS